MKSGNKKYRSMRVANLHIPSHILLILWSFIAMFPVWILDH